MPLYYSGLMFAALPAFWYFSKSDRISFVIAAALSTIMSMPAPDSLVRSSGTAGIFSTSASIFPNSPGQGVWRRHEAVATLEREVFQLQDARLVRRRDVRRRRRALRAPLSLRFSGFPCPA